MRTLPTTPRRRPPSGLAWTALLGLFALGSMRSAPAPALAGAGEAQAAQTERPAPESSEAQDPRERALERVRLEEELIEAERSAALLDSLDAALERMRAGVR